jgi:hypothetical protein
MPTVAARLRIRNAADTADLVTFGMAEMSEWPDGDGTQVNVITGAMRSGSYVVKIVDNLALTAVLNDGSGRGQLKSRRALLEVQTDGGAWVQRIGGYVTRVSIRDGHDAEIEVGESLRVPATAMVPDASLGASINRGCIVGGPVITSWGPVLALGGWRATVTAVSGRRVTMQITQTYTPPTNARQTSFAAMVADTGRAQAALNPFLERLENFEFGGIADVNANAPDLSARITRTSDAQVSVGTPRVVVVGSFINPTVGTPVFTGSTTILFTMDVRAGDPLPAVNDVVTLNIVSVVVSEASPAYLDGHPIDVVATLYNSIGVRLNIPSFTSVKAKLGDQLRFAQKVTEPFPLQAWIEQSIAGPLGVAFLPDANGDILATYMREPLVTAPSSQLTLDDLSAVESLFEDTEDSSVARLTWEQDQYVKIANPTADDPPDAVLANRARQEFVIDSGTTYATRAINYTIDGQYYTQGNWAAGPEVVSSVQRGQLALRYGRGAPETVFRCRRDSATVAALTIGSYTRCNVPSLPSGSARIATQPGISRVMQVTGITEGVGERVLTLEDLGPIGDALTLVPTLSISSSAQTYTVTLTNLAALNTAGNGVRFEVAQTSGAAPGADAWSPLRALNPGELATVSGSVTTIPTTVHVRARSERQGFLPSAWSATATQAFLGLPGITSLAAAAVSGDGSKLAITWTRATADGAVFDVFVRLSSQPQGTGIFASVLPAGSVSATATGLTAGTLYTVDVRVRAPFGVDQSVFSTTTQTTDGSVVTLSNPSALSAYVPMAGFVALDGIVTGTPLPDAEVEIAQETAVGSGTFGSYVVAGTATAVAGGAFTQTIAVASDNRLRRLRARAVRAGATASAYVVAPTDVLPDSSGML